MRRRSVPAVFGAVSPLYCNASAICRLEPAPACRSCVKYYRINAMKSRLKIPGGTAVSIIWYELHPAKQETCRTAGNVSFGDMVFPGDKVGTGIKSRSESAAPSALRLSGSLIRISRRFPNYCLRPMNPPTTACPLAAFDSENAPPISAGPAPLAPVVTAGPK